MGIHRFRLLKQDAELGYYMCLHCGEEFDTDATTEENLIFLEGCLYPWCPKCGNRDFSKKPGRRDVDAE